MSNINKIKTFEYFYTVGEVAERLMVTSETVRTMIRDGRLKGIKPSKKWLIKFNDLQEYIEKAEK